MTAALGEAPSLKRRCHGGRLRQAAHSGPGKARNPAKKDPRSLPLRSQRRGTAAADAPRRGGRRDGRRRNPPSEAALCEGASGGPLRRIRRDPPPRQSPRRVSAAGSLGRSGDEASASLALRPPFSSSRGAYLCRGLLGVGQDAVIAVQLLHGRHRSATPATRPRACQRHYHSPSLPHRRVWREEPPGRAATSGLFPPAAPPGDVAGVREPRRSRVAPD